MLVIKTERHKLFTVYLTWLNPILKLSKGELDILAALLTLHYSHRHYPLDRLNVLLTAPSTLEGIRKKIKINARLFNKLLDSLKNKGLLTEEGINAKLTNYPKNNKFKIFVGFEIS